jgi:dipeptidyl aminopeptidase/acylaminoacyl peptidase
MGMGKLSPALAVLGCATALALPLTLDAGIYGAPPEAFRVADTATGEQRDLIAGEDPPPVWDVAPDRKHILLNCLPHRESEDCGGLVVADIHAHGAHVIAHVPYEELEYSRASWSPSGKLIAFERLRRQSVAPELWLVSADGSDLHRFARDAWLGGWSPDSSRVVYVSYRPVPGCGNGGRLVVASVDGRKRRFVSPKRMTACPEDEAWSPDGRYVAYSAYADVDETQKVFVADVAHGRVDLIGLGRTPRWAPDGRLAYLAPAIKGPGPYTIKLSNYDGSNQRTMLRGVWRFGPWSPDGRQLPVERIPDPNRGASVLETRDRAGRLRAHLDDGAAWGFWSTGYGFWWKNSGGLLYFRYVGYH